VKEKVYYSHHKENDLKQNMTVADVLQLAPSTSENPQLMMSSLHLYRTRSLVVAVATSLS